EESLDSAEDLLRSYLITGWRCVQVASFRFSLLWPAFSALGSVSVAE
ncbi:hypothetical protein A2U01_0009939, partial [Trifolium medium]|nr:hypothetical protein [Trifolium medium]